MEGRSKCLSQELTRPTRRSWTTTGWLHTQKALSWFWTRSCKTCGHRSWGVGDYQNGFEETAEIIGVEARKFVEEKPKLLAKALKLMPLLPTAELDILVIEEMGKNYSGTGIDTNVVGRFRVQGEPEPDKPLIKRIVLLNITGGRMAMRMG